MEIERIRFSEQRYPTDIVHNGHQYVRGTVPASEAVRKLREMRRGVKEAKSEKDD